MVEIDTRSTIKSYDILYESCLDSVESNDIVNVQQTVFISLISVLKGISLSTD